jgi:hypothetical protein
MVKRISIFIGIALLLCFVMPASAAYVEVQNMDKYGDGTYESNFATFGFYSETKDLQRIQYFQPDANISVDKMEWEFGINGKAEISNYTVVLFQAFNNLTDYDLRTSNIMYSGVFTDTTAGVKSATFDDSIELKKDVWYGVHFLYDADGVYTNHEQFGIAGPKYLYLKSDADGAICNSAVWDGDIWVPNSRVIKLNLYTNDAKIHATSFENYSPAFSTDTSWTFSPNLDYTCNNKLSLNGETVSWINNTNSPSWTITSDMSGFNLLGNNTVELYSVNESNELTLTLTSYINQTNLYYEDLYFPISNPLPIIDNYGDLIVYARQYIYSSPDEGVTLNVASSDSGLNVYGSTKVFQYNDTVTFATTPYTGITRSVNGGQFETVLDGSFKSWDIIKDKHGAIYVGTYQLDDVNTSVFKSTDLGDTWTLVFNKDDSARHVHGMGFVGDVLYVQLGDFGLTPVTSGVGTWVSSDFGETWTQSQGYLQYTSVLDVLGTPVFGGDYNIMGYVSTVGSSGYNSSIFKEQYRNAVYSMMYDPVNDVLYGAMSADFNASAPVGIIASADRGKTWGHLIELPSVSHMSNISSTGYVYVTTNTATAIRFHTVTNEYVSSLDNIVDVFISGGSIIKNGDVFDVGYVTGTPHVLIYTNDPIELKCNNNQVYIKSNSGTTEVTSDCIVTGECTISPDGSVVSIIGTTDVTSIPSISIVPSSDAVSVTVSTWSNTRKVWTLSSETEQTVTHTIGDFPANTDIQIKRDDINYETVTSNETGYIEWVYDGGFSEHTFSIECHDFNASLTSGAYPLTTQFTTSSDGIDAYYWDFENDGIIDSTKQNPAHTYGQTGVYSVNLTVHTSEGNVSIVKPDYITVENPAFSEDPLAWFNWVLSYLFGRF